MHAIRSSVLEGDIVMLLLLLLIVIVLMTLTFLFVRVRSLLLISWTAWTTSSNAAYSTRATAACHS